MALASFVKLVPKPNGRTRPNINTSVWLDKKYRYTVLVSCAIPDIKIKELIENDLFINMIARIFQKC